MRVSNDYKWQLLFLDNSPMIEAIHRIHHHLSVVGRGFFLSPEHAPAPTHYCTHARNVDAFVFESYMYDPGIENFAGQTWSSNEHRVSKETLEQDKFRWQITKDGVEQHWSDAFKQTERPTKPAHLQLVPPAMNA
jgi:hypothetical protein